MDVDSSFKKNVGERRDKDKAEAAREDARVRDSLFKHECFI